MRPSNRPLRTATAALAVLLLGISAAACSLAPTTSDADLGGLLVLAGKTGDAELRAWEDGAAPADDRTVTTPKDVAWVAAGLADVLVADLASGALRLSDPIDPAEEPGWKKVRADGADGDPADGPFYFPTWDPEGGRFGALAGDLDGEPRLTLVDPSAGSAFDIEIGRPVAAAPPAWVGDDLVAVAVGDADAPASVLIDTTTGDVTRGPDGGRLFATSADGRTIAVVGEDGDTVTIRSTAGWLAGDGSSVGSIDAPAGALAPTAIALDADGTRLAIAWLDDGGSINVAIHDRSVAWRRVATVDVGPAAGAVVAWLR